MLSRGLKLRTEDYFLTDKNTVTVAERSPQSAFPLHHHDFDELVIVWRGNGLHLWNDVPYRITCGDLFYVSARDRHSYESVHDLELDNILYIRERLTLPTDWQNLCPAVRSRSSNVTGGWRPRAWISCATKWKTWRRSA